MGLKELGERWKKEAATLRRRGAAGHAELLESCVVELEEVDGVPTTRPAADVMLTLDEAAARLNVPKRWLTEHRHELPFLRQYVPAGTVRVSALGLARWLATRG